MKPVVAIIGRPNVGKSTFFNRLSKRKKVIVINEPGATRDRNYEDCTWNDRNFILIDTGGFEPVSTEKILIQMREQTTLAIEEADTIIFLMDGKEGLTPSDVEITNLLREVEKPTFFVINKIDGPKHEGFAYEFYRLGIERLYTISAEHGIGVGELMDDVVEHLPPSTAVSEDEDRIRIAVTGKPNVGKSSLINKMLGYDRTIVNPIPGTTRDAIDTPFELHDRKYLLIDTAGIRRKSKISITLEKYSVIQAIKTLSRSDIALILIDAEEGITDQDTKIAGLALERGVVCIIIVNKWDLIEKDNSTTGNYVKKIKEKLKFLNFAPTLFVSALTGQRVIKIFDTIETAYSQYTRRVQTSILNKKVREFLEMNPPPRYQQKVHNFSFVTQASVKPPTFMFFVHEPKAVHFSYQRYLTNKIREEFGFDQVPIKIILRKKNR
ncbi:MAG: ribosome biogenesis GTPase Der [Candidatus Eremiobacteraeota bacterium]|nr:ribosome biogenesis GTPase Der [Candidatus Eremiobacteraeota bacterium]